jgi:hypothetical protein
MGSKFRKCVLDEADETTCRKLPVIQFMTCPERLPGLPEIMRCRLGGSADLENPGQFFR